RALRPTAEHLRTSPVIGVRRALKLVLHGAGPVSVIDVNAPPDVLDERCFRSRRRPEILPWEPPVGTLRVSPRLRAVPELPVLPDHEYGDSAVPVPDERRLGNRAAVRAEEAGPFAEVPGATAERVLVGGAELAPRTAPGKLDRSVGARDGHGRARHREVH